MTSRWCPYLSPPGLLADLRAYTKRPNDTTMEINLAALGVRCSTYHIGSVTLKYSGDLRAAVMD